MIKFAQAEFCRFMVLWPTTAGKKNLQITASRNLDQSSAGFRRDYRGWLHTSSKPEQRILKLEVCNFMFLLRF